MCYFITFAVPGIHANHAADSIPRGLAVLRQENPAILERLPKEFVSFVITSGGCSCELYNDPDLIGEEQNQEEQETKLRKKYRKKGWSGNKIDKAVRQSLSSQQSIFVEPGLRDDVIEIISSIAELSETVFVLVHFYDGGICDEPVEIRRTLKFPLSEFSRTGKELQPDDLLLLSK